MILVLTFEEALRLRSALEADQASRLSPKYAQHRDAWQREINLNTVLIHMVNEMLKDNSTQIPA